jgi:hypothetical protein
VEGRERWGAALIGPLGPRVVQSRSGARGTGWQSTSWAWFGLFSEPSKMDGWMRVAWALSQTSPGLKIKLKLSNQLNLPRLGQGPSSVAGGPCNESQSRILSFWRAKSWWRSAGQGLGHRKPGLAQSTHCMGFWSFAVSDGCVS